MPSIRMFSSGDVATSRARSSPPISNQPWFVVREMSPFETIRMAGILARHTHYDGISLRELYGLMHLGLSIDPANVRNVTMPSAIGKVGAAEVVFPGAGTQELFADLRDDAILQNH